MDYIGILIKKLTETLDPRIDKLLGFDVPPKWIGAISTFVVYTLYCWLVH